MLKKAFTSIQKFYYKVENRVFDYQHKVQTSSPKDLHRMTIFSEAIEHARRYEPTPIPVLKKVLKKIDINFHNTNFVDLGSGKGLVLLYVSNFPFKKIIGVEFAQDLYLLSLQNLENYWKSKSHFKEIEIFFSDFSKWNDFPQGDNLYFMYNPCDGKILEDFVKNLPLSKARTYFLYVNPLRGFILEDYGFTLQKRFDHSNRNFVTHLYLR